MCHAHYQRFMAGKPMDEPIAEKVTTGPYVRNVGMVCSVDDCDVPAHTKGMCERHYKSTTGLGVLTGIKRRARKMQAPCEKSPPKTCRPSAPLRIPATSAASR